MKVYIVARVGRDYEDSSIVGYNPIKGFLAIDGAEHSAREEMKAYLAQFFPLYKEVELVEGVEDQERVLSFSHMVDEIVGWERPGVPIREPRRETARAMFAILTVEVDENG